jgi:protein-S-isoprenylcysteine O-methyltransferase Ste14
MRFLGLGLVWAAWCVLHSVMITPTVKGWAERRMGPFFPFYRLVYALVAVGTLAPAVLYAHSLQSAPLFAWEGVWRLAQAGLLAAGVALVVAGSRRYDALRMIGIRQILEARDGNVPQAEKGLDRGGIHAVLRHPWYMAALLLIWARSLDGAALTVNVVLTIYLVAGTFLEERKLIAEFGDEYRRYRREVSPLVPVKWLMKRFGKNAFRCLGL